MCCQMSIPSSVQFILIEQLQDLVLIRSFQIFQPFISGVLITALIYVIPSCLVRIFTVFMISFYILLLLQRSTCFFIYILHIYSFSNAQHTKCVPNMSAAFTFQTCPDGSAVRHLLIFYVSSSCDAECYYYPQSTSSEDCAFSI